MITTFNNNPAFGRKPDIACWKRPANPDRTNRKKQFPPKNHPYFKLKEKVDILSIRNVLKPKPKKTEAGIHKADPLQGNASLTLPLQKRRRGARVLHLDIAEVRRALMEGPLPPVPPAPKLSHKKLEVVPSPLPQSTLPDAGSDCAMELTESPKHESPNPFNAPPQFNFPKW